MSVISEALSDVVRERINDYCRTHVKFNYEKYLVSKWFGIRFIALIVSLIISNVLLLSIYGISTSSVGNFTMCDLLIIIIYGTTSFFRYEIEGEEARNKLEELCNDISMIGAEAVNNVAREMLNSIDNPLVEELAKYIDKRRELIELIEQTSDTETKKILENRLRNIDSTINNIITAISKDNNALSDFVKYIVTSTISHNNG